MESDANGGRSVYVATPVTPAAAKVNPTLAFQDTAIFVDTPSAIDRPEDKVFASNPDLDASRKEISSVSL